MAALLTRRIKACREALDKQQDSPSIHECYNGTLTFLQTGTH